MLHLLLDTNTLISLVSVPREENLLNRLERLVHTGQAKLLYPETLQLEWDKKKEQTLLNIKRTFSNADKYAGNEYIGSELDETFLIAQEKVGRIDELLHSGLHFRPTNHIRSSVMGRYEQGLPPFHRDKQQISLKDALIYFSTTAYLVKRGIMEFVFVSNNSSDFGAADQKNEKLHPDLEVPGLQIYYYCNLSRCFQHQKQHFQFSDEGGVKTRNAPIYLKPYHGEALLDYLYSVIQLYRKEIPFLPLHLLTQVFPFKTINPFYHYSYYSNGVLYSNNEDLYAFFAAIDLSTLRFLSTSPYKNSKKNLEKLQYIVQRLNDNHVFKIAVAGKANEVSIFYSNPVIDNSAVSQYYRLSFGSLIPYLPSEKDPVERGFVQFQLGQFAEAFSSVYAGYQDAVKAGHKAAAFRLLLNLRWIANYLLLEDSSNLKKKIEEIQSVDHEKMYRSLASSSGLVPKLASFLNSEKIIAHYAGEVREVLDKIRKHYQAQLRASYSSNNHFELLLHAFLQFELFTFYNGMCYTKFSDFKQVTEDFVEGIVLLLALNEFQRSGIERLDDFLLVRLVLHADPDKLIVLYNRHLKHPIPFQSADGAASTFIQNYLRTPALMLQSLVDRPYFESSQHFLTLFWNITLLLALVEVPPSIFTEYLAQLPKFLKSLPARETHKLNHLSSLVHSKSKYFTDVELTGLMQQLLDHSHLHNDDLLTTLANALVQRKISLIPTKKAFKELLDQYGGKCKKCGQFHKQILFTLYPSFSPPFQKQFSSKVLQDLKNEFDPDLYYRAVLFNVLDYQELFDTYLRFYEAPQPDDDRLPFLSGAIRFRKLNDVLNLVFKTKETLPEWFIERFRGISSYYDWLLDMETFDYSLFNPLWIIQYPTRYYLETAFSNAAVRESVRLYLQSHEQPTLAYYYTQYVGLDT